MAVEFGFRLALEPSLSIGHRPDNHAAVLAGGDDPGCVGRESGLPDPPTVPLKHTQAAARRRVPDSRRAVVGTAQDPSIVGREVEADYRVAMAFHDGERRPGRGIPQADAAVVSTRGDNSPGMGKRHGVNKTTVSNHERRRFVRECDDADASIPAPQKCAIPVGAVCDRFDRPFGLERLDALLAEVPEPARLPVAELALAALGQQALGVGECIVFDFRRRQADPRHVGFVLLRTSGRFGFFPGLFLVAAGALLGDSPLFGDVSRPDRFGFGLLGCPPGHGFIGTGDLRPLARLLRPVALFANLEIGRRDHGKNEHNQCQGDAFCVPQPADAGFAFAFAGLHFP